MRIFGRKRISTFQIIIAGFAAVILAGALLLLLPFATAGPGSATVEEALFTATSAVCVTGLVMQDTATYWSLFGQGVILLLIQIGGLGVVTVAVALTAAAGRRIGLIQRSTLQEALAAPQMGGIVRMTVFLLKFTFGIEAAGALLLYPAFYGRVGPLRAVWYALFHAVSAFCNAGFDLMGIDGVFGSLTGFADDWLVNTVIMLLIIGGGLGFLVWSDILHWKRQLRRYRLQSKVVLTTSALLILVPAVIFFCSEWPELPPLRRAWAALFQAVTARTAGFNTVDLTTFSEAGLLLMILLMLVGGSPGSTAGGMKTTTLAVLAASASAAFRRRNDPVLFGRRLESNAVRNAAALLLLYMGLCGGTAMLISRLEALPLLPCLFETASAIGTVGLTLGLTPQLGTVSHILLMLLMFWGRVGGLTILFAAVHAVAGPVQYPEEKIMVG